MLLYCACFTGVQWRICFYTQFVKLYWPVTIVTSYHRPIFSLSRVSTSVVDSGTTLTIWRPSNGLLSSLREGHCYDVFRLAVSEPRGGHRVSSRVQLTASRGSSFQRVESVPENTRDLIYEPREVSICLSSLHFFLSIPLYSSHSPLYLTLCSFN